MENIRQAEKQDVPAHIGIIMDGNGRWAQKRGLVRTQGHLEGLKAAKRITQAASDMGVKFLTLYAFSTENWKRAEQEVSFIMGLIRQYLRSELDFSRRNNIRVRLAGDIDGLPSEVRGDLYQTLSDTSDFTGMQVVLAINYGGRDEIVRAVRKFASVRLPSDSESVKNISEKDICEFLDNPEIPDPDLIIRSAGEYRTSNFLLWEGAYSELYISQKYWPDWGKEDLQAAVMEYNKRDRRYGGVAPNAA